MPAANDNKDLVKQLTDFLNGGSAHADYNKAVKDIPFELLGKVPDKLPYSIWQLAEHIRIVTWDMLEFSRDQNHKSPKWPDEYWVKEKAPADEKQWNKTVSDTKKHIREFTELLNDKADELHTPLPHGEGQTLLKEALQMADHTAYHTGEIIIIRRLLGAWKS